MLQERQLTQGIIECFFRVYDALGFGFLESVYRRALALELAASGLRAGSEEVIDVWYRAEKVGHFRADLIVEHKVIIEIKAAQTLVPADRKQLLNYLRGGPVELGLLLHFGPKARFERLIFTNDQKNNRARR
ncbi:MAG: GxxExxY protein [Gemmatimonadetes bacterium]|jgi:GxxExxY protein|nr:MAG: GxxExxY protein [Gemmatimonadota bacterium]